MNGKRKYNQNFIVDNFLFGDESNLKNDTDLFKESVIDSTGILELIAYIEMTYNIKN
jgi:acyl carrier protein